MQLLSFLLMVAVVDANVTVVAGDIVAGVVAVGAVGV